MCRKQFIVRGKTFIAWLIGILVFLSGCGKSENIKIDSDKLLTEIDNNCVNIEENTRLAEIEDKGKDDENNESSENLSKPSEIPVNIKEEDFHYYSEDGIDLLRTLHRCISDGKNIYLVYGEPDLYVMPISTDEHYPAQIDNPDGMDVCNIALDMYGRIHLLMAGRNNEEWFIWRLDESCQVDAMIDVSAYFETRHMPLWFLIDKDGTYYFQWTMDRDGIIVDSEGVLKHKFTPESFGAKWIYEAAAGKDGNIYIVYNDSDEKLEIGKLDVEKCLIKNETPMLSFENNEIFNAMSSGTDTNLLLFSPYSGVWACDNEKGIIENRVPLSDIYFGPNIESWPLTFLPDGRLLMLGQTVENNHADTVDEESFKYWILKYIPAGK